jgi:protein strawberry notch
VNFDHLRATAGRVRVIPLQKVLAVIGAERDLFDVAKWHTDLGALSVTGAKFFNWNRGAGGGGAIDLVMHLEGLDFRATVEWLAQRFPDDSSSRNQDPPRAQYLRLPSRNAAKLTDVTTYLVHERNLAWAVIGPLVVAGKIYADDRGNAVFVMTGDEQRPVGAEIRGTTSLPWKGLASGSRKDLGYFSVAAPNATKIILCESAIDAMSCFILRPGSLCISTAGARTSPRWLESLVSDVRQIYCAFDADPTGDDMARGMIELYPQVRRLRPPSQDWNEALCAKG